MRRILFRPLVLAALVLGLPASAPAVPEVYAVNPANGTGGLGVPAKVVTGTVGKVELYFNIDIDTDCGISVIVNGATTTFDDITGEDVGGTGTVVNIVDPGPGSAEARHLFGPCAETALPMGPHLFGTLTISAGAAGEVLTLAAGSEYVEGLTAQPMGNLGGVVVEIVGVGIPTLGSSALIGTLAALLVFASAVVASRTGRG